MKPTLGSLLQGTKSILILLPKSPYFDQVAASTGLFLSLKDKYETIIHSPSPMLVEFNHLVGVDRVTSELANKNVVIKLINYPASQIERVLYDTDGVNDLALTVISKPGVPTPRPENFTFSSQGISVDTVILIGGANDTHFPSLSLPDLANAKLIHIGRESVVLPGREVLSLSRPASSFSELVTKILKESDFEISADCATNLLSGVIEGTRNFADQTVSAETFRTVADLLESGARRVSAPKSPVSNPFKPNPTPQSTEPSAPKSWLEPKIYKGSNV